MSGAFNARRQRRRPTINITSLIDVMFLLLIFFMVSSTFRERLGVNIELPTAQTSAPQDIETTEVTVDAEGTFYFGEQKVDAAGLKAHLAELAQDDPDVALILRCDNEAPFGAYFEAFDIVREVGLRRVTIPSKPKEPSVP